MQRLGGMEEVASVLDSKERWHLRGGKIWARKRGENIPSGGTAGTQATEMWDSPGYQGVGMPSQMEEKSTR